MNKYFLLYLKGIAMGAADVVPGVSGGTIAFISGIYQELIDSIRAVNPTALKLLLKFDIKGLWAHLNATFLVVLLSGIGTSILLLSSLVLYLLDTYPVLLWSFFLGLIIASTVLVAKTIGKWSIGVIISALIGIGIAYWTTVATQVQTPNDLWFIFLCGMIAICAMILPGISGSFILVILGKYEYILGSLKELNFAVIFTFAAGCLLGITSFSHVLNFMLKKYHDLAIALLAGFMVGSLNKVYPWKKVLETYTDRHGVVKPLVTENVFPSEYAGDPYLISSILLMIFGFAVVYFIEKMAVKKEVE
ncbi:MAG: DUF368 domain-containing protein [Bacteroidetes bacterium]|nr:MAG: DUF368 domain-containing protein [Bacteroidota bacterium]